MAAKRGLTHNLMKGSKFNQSHTTLVSDAIPLVRAAGKDDRVSKVRLGYIHSDGSNYPRVVFTKIHGGLRVMIHGRNGGQEIHVYTSCPTDVQQKLQDVWNSRR